MASPTRMEELWKQAEIRFFEKTKKQLKPSSSPVDLQEAFDRLSKHYDKDAPPSKKKQVAGLVEKICQCAKLLGGMVAGAASQVFPGAGACFQALSYLLDMPKRVSGLFEGLEQLFHEIAGSWQEFKIYEKIESYRTMSQDLIMAVHEVMVCFVDICALAITMLGPSKWEDKAKMLAKKVLFDNDSGIENELKRFRQLVNHKCQIVAATTLENVLKSQHDSTSAMRDLFNFLQSDAKEKDERLERIETKIDDFQEEQRNASNTVPIMDILKWLSSSNVSDHYGEARSRFADGTGSWFVELSEFQQWYKGDKKCILLHGITGSGKTVLMSTAVAHIKESMGGDPHQNLSYFFFRTQSGMSTDDLLAYLIRSRCSPENEQSRSTRHTILRQALEVKCLRGDRPCQDDLLNCFKSLVGTDKVYIIIDALDESGKIESGNIRGQRGLAGAKRKVIEMLGHFYDIKNLQFLISCRDGPFCDDIKKKLDQLQKTTKIRYADVFMDESHVNPDITVLIQQRLNINLYKFLEKNTGWREKIQARIKPDGMFLLVARQLDLFEQRIAECQDIEEVLNELPEDVNGVYRAILNKIPGGYRPTAIMVLKWLLTAQRPLYCKELEELIDRNHKEPSSFDVFEVFSNLLIRHNDDEQDDQQVMWAHDTSIREYLTKEHSGEFHIDLLEAHKTFAKTCIHYLKLPFPEKRHTSSDAACQDCPRKLNFIRYAADNWYKHAVFMTAGELPDTEKLIITNMKSSLKGSTLILWLWLQILTFLSKSAGLMMLFHSYEPNKEIQPVSSASNLADGGNSLVKWHETTINIIDAPIISKDAFQQQIKTAAIEGYREITKLLLLHGCAVESSHQSYDALMAAATCKYTALLAVLLEIRTETFLKSEWWTGNHGGEIDDPRNEDIAVSICQLLLEFGANPEKENKFQQTALHLASGCPHHKIVKILASRAKNIDQKDYSGATALHFAATSGSLAVVKELISHGSDLNARSILQKGKTKQTTKVRDTHNFKPRDYELIQAAEENNEGRFLELIKAGANVQATDVDGSTALHWTLCHDAANLSRLLIDRGADVNAIRTSGKYLGKTPLLEASRKPTTIDLMRDLLRRGADPNIRDIGRFWERTALHEVALRGREELVNILIEYGADANAHDHQNQTPADLAREQNYEEVAAILDRANSGVAARGGRGETPLHMACENNHYEIVEELISRGAALNYQAEDGTTVLRSAAIGGSHHLFKLLLSKGASPDVKGHPHWSVLHEAASRGNIEIVKLLLTGPDVDINLGDNHHFRTPLFYAVQNRHIEVIKLLMEKGAEVNVHDTDYQTPLQVACLNGWVDITKLLLTGPNVDINLGDDRHSRTPLFYAVQGGHIEVVRLLMEKGAEINVHDRDYQTPVSVARSRNHGKIAEILIEEGGAYECGPAVVIILHKYLPFCIFCRDSYFEYFEFKEDL